MTNHLFFITAVALMIFIAIAMIRLLISKTLPDRVVALDTINTIIMTILVLLSAAFKTIIYIDVAIVYALLSFIGTLYIARYLGEKQW